MDIVNFFETVEGTWFSQRTTHFAPGQPSQTGQTTLEITRIATDDSRVNDLCQQFATDVSHAIVALVIRQEARTSTYGGGSSSPARSTLFVVTKSAEDLTGTFFSQTDREPAVQGTYALENDVLSLSIQTNEFTSHERWWYMNPNLRMRTSLVERVDDARMASFCSEIRRLSK